MEHCSYHKKQSQLNLRVEDFNRPKLFDKRGGNNQMAQF